MGFSLQGYGNVHSCWIQDGYIYEETECTKSVFKYATRLTDVTIPKQRNLFFSRTVAFYLKHDGKVYIGRYDGVISIYRESDNMLVGLNNWDTPGKPDLQTAGFLYTPVGVKTVYLDKRDNRTLYFNHQQIEAALKKPFLETYSDVFDMNNKDVNGSIEDWKIYTSGGEAIGIDVWSVQNDLWRRNCAVFL